MCKVPEQVKSSYTDEEFVAELQERVTGLIISNRSFDDITVLVTAALDSMIVDKLVGPTFHQEVETVVDLDKTTGVMDISLRLCLPGKVEPANVVLEE
jgi:hypothetical protein